MRVLAAVLDVLFPPRCPSCGIRTRAVALCGACEAQIPTAGSPLCTICGLPFGDQGLDHLCAACTRRRPRFTLARARTMYGPGGRNPAVELLHRLKYGRDLAMAPILAGLLADAMPVRGEYEVVVPVPLHRARLRWRGFNQAVPLARAVAHRWRCPVDVLALARHRATPPQVGLPAAARRANVRDAFVLRRPAAVDRRRVLLIDDVMTTGATLDECSGVLLRAGARTVDALVLARALESA